MQIKNSTVTKEPQAFSMLDHSSPFKHTCFVSARKAHSRIRCMRYLILLFSLWGFLMPHTGLHAQTPADTINPESFDQALVQLLLRSGIDSLRAAAGKTSLENDSILTAAATDHATYLVTSRWIGHTQPNPEKKNVNKRVEFFGGKNYLCGENVAASYALELMEDKQTRRLYHNYTYQDLADEFISLWQNSPPHYQNLLNNLYSCTGISVVINPLTNRVTAVQVFGYRKKE